MPDNLAYGVDAKAFAKIEATFDTPAAFAATNAVALAEVLKLQPEQAAEPIKGHVGTASRQGFVIGKKSGKWTAPAEIRPNAAGTAPDFGADILKAAFGTETVSGGVSVTYALNDSPAQSLALGHLLGASAWEGCTGAWVEQLDIEVQGGGQAKMSAQGGYASHVWAYATTVGTGGALNGATSCPYANVAGDKGNLGVGASVTIGAQTNGGAGYLITAVNDTPTPPTITFTPALGGAVSAGDAIVPVAPAMTIGGTTLGAVECSLTVDGTAVGFISAKVSLKTGYHAVDKEANTNRASGVARGEREVTGEIQFYFKNSSTGPLLGRAWSGTTRALVLRIGPATAGKKATINVPKAFIDVVPLDIPEAEEATFTLKIRAQQNAAAADEMTLVFD